MAQANKKHTDTYTHMHTHIHGSYILFCFEEQNKERKKTVSVVEQTFKQDTNFLLCNTEKHGTICLQCLPMEWQK